MTVQPADDWHQNADVALMQSQRLERSEQPSTEEQLMMFMVISFLVGMLVLHRCQLLIRSAGTACRGAESRGTKDVEELWGMGERDVFLPSQLRV